MKTKPLGKQKKTSRGFNIVLFEDHYRVKCSLQASINHSMNTKQHTFDMYLPASWLEPDPKSANPATDLFHRIWAMAMVRAPRGEFTWCGDIVRFWL